VADRGTHTVTFKVRDDGNGGAGTPAEAAQTIDIVVRDTNAPQFCFPWATCPWPRATSFRCSSR